MDKRVCIFQAANAIEANVVKGLLLGEGIDTTLQGEHLTGAMGELPPTDLTIGVWISQIKSAPAQTIINQYVEAQKAANNSANDWVCASCGEKNSSNFEICWQCQTDPNE